jgi:hypothetical protein
MSRLGSRADGSDAGDISTAPETPTLTAEISASAANEAAGAEVRAYERRPTEYKVILQFREGPDDVWKEQTVLNTFSRNGAAVTLSRKIPIGRLVSMATEIPAEDRLYDHGKAVYPMLGIVQHCFQMPNEDGEAYNVGLAFIGKVFPESFKRDPKQCYRLTGMDKDGLWLVTEAADQFQARKHSRFWRQFKISIAIRDEETRTSRKAEVTTRDISAGGLSFFGDVDAKAGDRVKVVIPETEFFTLATIRNISRSSKGEKGQNIYHLEFDKPELPVDILMRSDKSPIPRSSHDSVVSKDGGSDGAVPAETSQPESDSGPDVEPELTKF